MDSTGKASSRNVAAATGVSHKFVQKVINEVNSGGLVDPATVERNHVRGIGARSLTVTNEAVLIFFYNDCPSRTLENYQNILVQTTGTSVDASTISRWFNSCHLFRGRARKSNMVPLGPSKTPSTIPDCSSSHHLNGRRTGTDPHSDEEDALDLRLVDSSSSSEKENWQHPIQNKWESHRLASLSTVEIDTARDAPRTTAALLQPRIWKPSLPAKWNAPRTAAALLQPRIWKPSFLAERDAPRDTPRTAAVLQPRISKPSLPAK
jgi:hypothetical protein